MKKIIILLIVICLLVASYFCVFSDKSEDRINYIEGTGTSIEDSSFLKGVWLSYIELADMFSEEGEESFTASFNEVIENMVISEQTAVIVQVRPFTDAIYPSEIFPWSSICTGTRGQALEYDPLSIMTEICRENNIEIHFWINPYRVSSTGIEYENISISDGWINYEKDVIIVGNGVYLSPASEDVNNLILAGIEELILNYSPDGIHFDDYFYPTTDYSFDADYYSDYLASGGELSQSDFRLDTVSTLISSVYALVKSLDEEIVFGVSPQGNISNNYSSQYADVERWVSEPGFVDYICPQIYYGFENETISFTECLDQWTSLSNCGVDIIVGLTFSKLNTVDTFAGDSGENEWIEDNEIILKMAQTIKENDSVAGYILFRYGIVFSEENSSHLEYLNSIL